VPSPSGVQTLDVTAFGQRERKTERNFRIIESLRSLKGADCVPERLRANWAYPIAGSVGIDEIVRTYLRLEALTNFGKSTGPSTALPFPTQQRSKEIPVVFSDVLTYTTHFGAGIKPTLNLETAFGKIKLTDASILGDANRKDVHKVTIALARDPPVSEMDPAGNARGANTRTSRNRRSEERYVRNAPFVSRGADVVAQRVLPAEAQVLVELERRRTLAEDARLSTRLIDALTKQP
jgi:hypothetical protein